MSVFTAISLERADNAILGWNCRLLVDHGSKAILSMVSDRMGVPTNIYYYFYFLFQSHVILFYVVLCYFTLFYFIFLLSLFSANENH